jgi:hypothetical protein
MDEQKLSRLHAIVEGRVQGVSFRYFVSEQHILGDHGLGAQPHGWQRRV